MLKITQNSWLGGQLDEEMAGRQDVNKYRIGSSVLENFLPVRRGSIRKRPGTDLLANITAYIGTSKFRMIPFPFTTGRGYVIVFGDHKARAYCGDGTFVDVSGVVPYSADDLDAISYTQSNDVMFLAHSGYMPAQISHDMGEGVHTFSIEVCPINKTANAPSISRCAIQRLNVAGAYRGAVRTEEYAASCIMEKNGITFETCLGSAFSNSNANGEAGGTYSGSQSWDSTAYYLPWTESQRIDIRVMSFAPAVGEKIKSLRIYKREGGIWGLICEKELSLAIGETLYNEVLTDFNYTPDTSVTPMENKTVFNEPGDFPGCVALYQQRLVWAGSTNDPARIWMSEAGSLYECRPHTSLLTSDPIDFLLPLLQFARINFIVELGRLIVFADSCEVIVGSDSTNSGISYETIMATAQSHIGCKRRLPPIIANNSIIFCERTGMAVRDYGYDVTRNLYGGEDLSVYSSSIFDECAIVDWTYQQFPNSTIWCVLSDGRMAALTYMKDQNVCAWSVHRAGGGGKFKAVAKTGALIGSDANNPNTSEVLVVVERAGTYTLERMRPWNTSEDMPANAVTMDCCEAGNVTGKTYVAAANKSGYMFEAKMTTVRPVLGDAVGNAQFDIKNVQHAHLRTLNSVGGEVYAEGMETRSTALKSTVLPEVTGGKMTFAEHDDRCLLSGSNNRSGRITVKQAEPWPFQLLLLEQDVEVEEGGQG